MQFSAMANKLAAFLRLTVHVFKKEEEDKRLGKGVSTVEYIARCSINGL